MRGQLSTTTIYIFSGSKVIAEYVNGSLSKEYVYSGSALLATHEGATLRYHHPDHLGTRVDSDTAGNWTRKFGHFPFGESWYEDLQGGGAASKWKFTTYERDGESGLDQAMFRYDSPRLGRFMSPDPLGGGIVNPQSLNRYGYVGNDPVNLIDPTGLDWWDVWMDASKHIGILQDFGAWANGIDDREFWRERWYDLPGNFDPARQGEFEYLKQVYSYDGVFRYAWYLQLVPDPMRKLACDPEVIKGPQCSLGTSQAGECRRINHRQEGSRLPDRPRSARQPQARQSSGWAKRLGALDPRCTKYPRRGSYSSQWWASF